MKIKLSKSQWEKMGKEAGWMKKQATMKNIGQIGTVSLLQSPDGQFFQIEVNLTNGLAFILTGTEDDVATIHEALQQLTPQKSPVPTQAMPRQQTNPMAQQPQA